MLAQRLAGMRVRGVDDQGQDDELPISDNNYRMLYAGRVSPSRTSGMTSAAKRRRASASARATLSTVNPACAMYEPQILRAFPGQPRRGDVRRWERRGIDAHWRDP